MNNRGPRQNAALSRFARGSNGEQNMLAKRSRGTTRSLLAINALLLSTAFAAPAFAQIEEVVVTAQKRTEDIQNVPIAISAFTSEDMAAHQIKTFADIQFAMPNVTVSNDTFGASNFSVRGIGTGSVGITADAGVSVNQNEVYISRSSTFITASSYYDVERVEVDRGPQGTLFGQNATGGAVNIITNKPDLNSFAANGEATYGNYNGQQYRAVLNAPIVDGQLAVRLAGFYDSRDGDIKNVYDQEAVAEGQSNPGLPSTLDSRKDWSLRGSARWQPSDDTTVDFLWSDSFEHDSRARTISQACTTDPSGILGCLPTARNMENINLDATTNTDLLSNIGPLGGLGVQLYNITGPNATNGSTAVGSIAQIPDNLREVDTDFQPVSVGTENFMSLTWKQQIFPWLSSTMIGGLAHDEGYARQATEGTPGDPFDLPQYLASPGVTKVEQLETLINALFPSNGAILTDNGTKFGELPISAPSGYGLSSGQILDYANYMQGYDEESARSDERSFEWRFASSFSGPFNFLFGVSHLEFQEQNSYFVAQTGIDLASVAFGAVKDGGNGFLAVPSIYDNDQSYQSRSSSVFGEAYYSLIPDTLRLTLGGRWTTDDKTAISEQATLFCPAPIGSTAAQISAILASSTLCPANPINPQGSLATAPLYQKAQFNSVTGRGVLSWTPKLDFTDQTLVYASYSHGNRPGGFNPPSFIPGLVPNTFAPEDVDALELGTKNTLLNGTLQEDATVWGYEYRGYQISSIVNRTSLNSNINATLYGVEDELIWAPDSHWAFNLNFGVTNSSIGAGNSMQVDPRNPTHGNPDALVLKDYQGSNCILQTHNGTAPSVGGFNALVGSSALVAPPNPLPTSIAAGGAYINYNASNPLGEPLSCSNLGLLLHMLDPTGATFVYNTNLSNTVNPYVTPGGIPVSVKGNELPNVPPVNISAGVQYTFDFDGGYALVPRLDYYWKSKMYSEIFNTPEDRIEGWGELNAQVQLNGPDSRYYARIWVKNALNSDNVTGTATGSDAQGLFTNQFLEDPRTYGITLGASF